MTCRWLISILAVVVASCTSLAGQECGPALDVVLKKTDGGEISLLNAVTGDGVFTCELGPHHFADPGETERLVLGWRVTGVAGTFQAHARLRRTEEFRSKSITLVVR
jgi:hypothetical protein